MEFTSYCAIYEVNFWDQAGNYSKQILKFLIAHINLKAETVYGRWGAKLNF